MKAPISGTFIDEITYDIPSSNWSQDQWRQDLDNMKAVGIDTLIFIRGGLCEKTIYPSKYFKTTDTDDFLGFMLTEAEKRSQEGKGYQLAGHFCKVDAAKLEITLAVE